MRRRSLDTPLVALQRFITEAVRRTSQVESSATLTQEAEALIAPSARGMRAAQRLDVYREQFWNRHLPCLQDDYPTLAWAIGGDSFRELATEYFATFPPSTWNLQELGANMPSYVERHAPWCDDALARDAARLDWAFMQAFDAADAPPLDPGVFASVPDHVWPYARIHFHPSLRSLTLDYPLHESRATLKQGQTCERPEARVTRVVVQRDNACFLRAATVEAAAFELLSGLARGLCLGEACEQVSRASVETDVSGLALRVGAWFREWTTNGWVSRVDFDQP